MKVLVVAVALCLLAYAIYRKGTFKKILEPSDLVSKDQLALQVTGLEQANQQIDALKAQAAELQREKENCQKIVSSQGSGLASKNDVAAELRASLNLRQREIANLQAALSKTQADLTTLKNEYEQSVQSAVQAKETLLRLESQMDVLQNEKVSLAAKLESSSKPRATRCRRS